MKARNVFALCAVVLLAASGFAQQNTIVTIFTGYTMTAFDGQASAAGTIPVAASIGFKAAPALEIGGEFFYPIGGYQFKVTGFGETITTTFNQMMAGVYGKYCFGESSMKPFLKAGVADYFGNMKLEMSGSSTTGSVKSAIGFNVGGGVQWENGLLVGFTYNIVKRDGSGMNTWAAMIGYQIIK